MCKVQRYEQALPMKYSDDNQQYYQNAIYSIIRSLSESYTTNGLY